MADPYKSQWIDASNVRVTVGGVVLLSRSGSLDIHNSIGQRSTASAIIEDLPGTTQFLQGEVVQVINGGTKNLLTGNQSSTVADLTGFTANGTGTVTMTRDGTTFPPSVTNITASTKIVADGTATQQGFTILVPAATFVGSAQYVFSVWANMTAARAAAVIVQLADSPFTTLGQVNFTGTGGWQQIVVPFTTPAMVTGTGLKFFLVSTSSGGGSFTLLGSALQLERDTQVSPWHRGKTLGGSLLFGGVISDAFRTRIGYSGIYEDQIQLIDWHYLADKRTVATTYSQRTCGSMFKDLINNWLAAEGVTYQRGINVFEHNMTYFDVPSCLNWYVGGTTTSGVGPLTGSNATISIDGSTSFTDEWSLKCVTGGVATHEGTQARSPNMTPYAPGAVYAVSVYAKSSPNLSLRIFAADSNGSLGTITNYSVTSAWTRYVAIFQMPNPITATWVGIQVDTNGTQAGTFWVDNAQMERIDQPTDWALGGGGVNTILTAVQSNAEGTTAAYTAVNSATLSIDKTTQWQGNSSLNVVTPGSVNGEGYRVGAVAAGYTTGNWYTGSVYLWGSGNVTVSFGQLGGAQVASLNVSLTSIPTRYSVCGQLTGVLSGSYGFTVITNGTQAVTFNADGMQIEQANATAWELGGLTPSIQDGPVVVSYIAPYIPGSKVADDLATLAGFFWQIDQNKVAWFQAPTTTPASWSFDGTQADGLAYSGLREANPQYRNSQWLTNIKDVTAVQTESRKGDGTARNFSFSYPFHSVPTVTVNGTAKTVGLKGVDDLTHSKNWYWNEGSDILAQEVNDAVLISTDTLQAVYVGEFINNINSQDSTAIAVQAALEGSGTGLVEEAHTDSTISTSAQAFSSAAALLKKYALAGRELQFDTMWGGLAPGQSLPINMASGWMISGVNGLVESVDMKTDGPWWRYTVKVVIGPFNQTWVQFLNQLANPQIPIPGSSGTLGILTLSPSFPVAWSWTATMTPLVVACPICGNSTLCGNSTIVC